MARSLDPGLSHQVHVWKTRIKTMPEGFPGGSVVKNPPASAGHAGVIPAMGRSHMLWSPWPQLPSLCSRSWKTQCRAHILQPLKPLSLCPTRGDTRVRSPHTTSYGPCSPKLGKSPHTKTQHSQK